MGEAQVIGVAAALVLGVAVPWAAMCLFAPTIIAVRGRAVENYRGISVTPGLGAAWIVWGGCATIAAWSLRATGALPTVADLLEVAGLLSVVAAAFGLLDDAYGTRDVRGFSGHMRALAGEGRLTTGGLKLLGIGVASVAAARAIAPSAQWGEDAGGVLVAGIAVALSANLLNLLDLRPGRALKAYLVLVATSAACLAFGASGDGWSGALVLALMLTGPVIAVWRFDLGERAMLGDAGANAMGAVAGLVLVTMLSFEGVVVFGSAMLGLNLLSERVSFTALIERVPLLAWLDSLGRRREHAASSSELPHGERPTRYDEKDGAHDGSREV